MIFRELHQLAGQASAAAGLQLNLLLEKCCESSEQTLRRKLEFADLSLVARELRHHLEGLRRILMVCKAVEVGRYLEDWQQCDKRWGACTGCTSAEDCLVFDDREPHAVISSVLSRLSPLSDLARQWLLRLGSYSQTLAEEAFGKETLRGIGSIAIDCGGERRLLVLARAERAATMRTAHDAPADPEGDSWPSASSSMNATDSASST